MSICIFAEFHTNVAICSSKHNIYKGHTCVSIFNTTIHIKNKPNIDIIQGILVNDLRNNLRVLFDNVIHFLARNSFLPKLYVSIRGQLFKSRLAQPWVYVK